MTPRIAVVGATGYVGSELCRWLLEHPQFELAAVTSHTHAGKHLGEVVPGLFGLTDLILEPFDPRELSAFDAVLLATPHGISAEYVPALEAAHVPRILELSSDHRTDPAWVYGLAEWNESALLGATRIAVPGCFATAVQLAVAPFVAADAVQGPICIAAATGSTGSGAAPVAGTHHPERFVNFKAYKVFTHKHLKEMHAFLGILGTAPQLHFVPLSAPLDRGIFATVFIPTDERTDPNGLLRAAYADRPLIRFREDSPELRHVRGTAFADISVHREGAMTTVLVAIDNLGKGAAAQAIQCLNLSFRLPADTGLRRAPCTP